MKKSFTCLLIIVSTCLISTNGIYSQDTVTHWFKGGDFGLNFSQVGLRNWTGGGKSMISVAGLISLWGKYNDKNAIWENNLELGYGMTRQDIPDLIKSDDRIVFNSKFGYKATEELSYSALLNFRTQFTEGFNYDKKDSLGNPVKISNFMAPGFLSLGLGMNYKPVEYFSLMFAPIANRIVFVLDDTLSAQGAFGVERGKKIIEKANELILSTYQRTSYSRAKTDNTLATKKGNIFASLCLLA